MQRGEIGPTDADNLVMLCSLHHSVVHEGEWSIRGCPATKLAFIRPDGTELNTARPVRDEVRGRLLPRLDE
jgi:hypothetical protein